MTPRRKVRVALALWLAFAVVVWNVVFDRLIVLAGRRYVHDAAESAAQRGVYLRVDDWMDSATANAAWTASLAAGAIAIVGVALVWVGARRRHSR